MLKNINCAFLGNRKGSIHRGTGGSKVLLQVFHRDMRRQKCGDVLAVTDQVAHHGRADEGVLRLREEEDRVDTRQTTVGVGDGLLILEVLNGADAPENDVGIDLPGEVHRQGVIAFHGDMRLVTKRFGDDLISLLDGEECLLRIIHTNRDHHFVHEIQRTLHDRIVSYRKRIETTRKYSYSHLLFFAKVQIIC